MTLGESETVERQQREAREPVFAHIVARDVREGDGKMVLRGGFGDRRDGVVRPDRCGDRAPAPRAAEIEAVEMRDLAVAAVADARTSSASALSVGAKIIRWSCMVSIFSDSCWLRCLWQLF